MIKRIGTLLILFLLIIDSFNQLYTNQKYAQAQDIVSIENSLVLPWELVPIISRVSVSSNSDQGAGSSKWPSISQDGRYVAFESVASNLVSGDTNLSSDIFVYDRASNILKRVSVSSTGVQANNLSVFPRISANGRYIVFQSWATNLVSQSLDTAMNIYVHDLVTGLTTYVGPGENQYPGQFPLKMISISGDGRYVTFASDNSSLVNNDTNGKVDVFVYDRQNSQTIRISVSSNGTQANNVAYSGDISSDGQSIAYYSLASNLVSNDTNGTMDVFVFDKQSGQTKRVSVTSTGGQSNGYSANPSISEDGRYVTFDSSASNLVVGDTNARTDIFVHDRQTGQTSRISVSSNGQQGNGESSHPTISPGGRYVAFSSYATNLVENDNNTYCDLDNNGTYNENCPDIFIHDRQTGDTFLVSVDPYGYSGNKESDNFADYAKVDITDDEELVIAFTSRANNLIDMNSKYADTSGHWDIYVNTNFRNCPVPFFSQRDGSWEKHPLGTNGECGAECATIGACGCALTSASMEFAYYGSDKNPKSLSDCMGTSACPFNWWSGSACSGNNSATFVEKRPFSWHLLEEELHLKTRPVLLEMHRISNPEITHWVVILDGYGNNPANYTIYDPWFLGGTNMKLSTRSEDYAFDNLAVYSGVANCDPTKEHLILDDPLPDISLNLALNTIPDSRNIMASSEITGSVTLYHMTEIIMSVQLSATSEVGDVTEMMIWTDSSPNVEWQPYSSSALLYTSEYVYVQFRDEFGNESEVFTDSIHPKHSPTAFEILRNYLPTINKTPYLTNP